MVTLRGDGCSIGEYICNGEREANETASAPATDGPMDTDPVDECQYSEGEDNKENEICESDDSHPLLVLFDVETTGLSIYVDHITDIGAKVLDPPRNRYWCQSARSSGATHCPNVLEPGEDWTDDFCPNTVCH